MASSTKPVICLVHGAWHYPLYYRRLIDPLRVQGYTVLAPTNATAGIDDSIAGKTYVDDVKRIHEVLLPHLDAGREAIVACHSYGGIPGTAALEGQTVEERAAKGLRGGVRAILYYASAGIPRRGISMSTLEGRKPSDWLRKEGEMRAVNPQAAELFYNDIPEEERAKYVAGLLYQSEASLTTGADYAATELKIPKTYVVCTKDRCISATAQRDMASAMGAKVVEFACGHSPFLKDAESKELVNVIMDLAG